MGLRDRIAGINAKRANMQSPGAQRIRELLPADIVDGLVACGKHELGRDGGPDRYGPYVHEIKYAPPDRQMAWLAALAEVALPLGGWAVHGAARTAVITLGTNCVRIPEACALVDASLEFQRAGGMWLSELCIFEKMHWEAHHSGELWLTPRPVPTREAAPITPIPLGTERKIAVISRVPDSNEIYIAHTAIGEHVAILDMPVERGTDRGRVRESHDRSADVYEIYRVVARRIFFPNYWNDPEFEPFFAYPSPRI